MPNIEAYGKFLHVQDVRDKPAQFYFYVMPKFGTMNLLEKFGHASYHFSAKAIFQIAYQLIDALQYVHRADYVFCDLKLENIIVEDDISGDDPENYRVHLVDFGFAQKYADHKRTDTDEIKKFHIAESEVKTLRSNMFNASLHILEFKTPSRRDDLIMLCYLILGLLNGGDLPGMTSEAFHLQDA